MKHLNKLRQAAVIQKQFLLLKQLSKLLRAIRKGGSIYVLSKLMLGQGVYLTEAGEHGTMILVGLVYENFC